MRVAFTTLGCRLNQFETEGMRQRVRGAAYETVDFEDVADLYVINSCAVTARAEQKCRQIARAVRRRQPAARVVVAGCYAQLSGDRLMASGEIDAVLGNDGMLEGTFKLTGSGALDGRLRRMVSGSHRHDLVNTFARILAPVSDRVEAVEFDHHKADDFSEDMWIVIRYRIPHFAKAVAGGFEFSSPMMNVVLNDGSLFRAGASEWSDKRTTDVFLYYTQLIDGTEKIRLPRGFKAVDLPSSDEIDETYAYFKGSSAMEGRSLTITQRAEIRRRQIPPEGYGGFKRAIDEAKEWGQTSYRIEKGGRS